MERRCVTLLCELPRLPADCRAKANPRGRTGRVECIVHTIKKGKSLTTIDRDRSQYTTSANKLQHSYHSMTTKSALMLAFTILLLICVPPTLGVPCQEGTAGYAIECDESSDCPQVANSFIPGPTCYGTCSLEGKGLKEDTTCHCIPRNGKCPERPPAPGSYDSVTILALRSQTATNPYDLTCDPFTEQGCKTSPEQMFINSGNTAVCGLLYSECYDTNSDGSATYSLQTYPNKQQAIKNGAVITHIGGRLISFCCLLHTDIGKTP